MMTKINAILPATQPVMAQAIALDVGMAEFKEESPEMLPVV